MRRSLVEEDQHLWQSKNGKDKTKFSSQDTWNNIRLARHKVDWCRGILFKHATPKFSFTAWLVIHKPSHNGKSNGAMECRNFIGMRLMSTHIGNAQSPLLLAHSLPKYRILSHTVCSVTHILQTGIQFSASEDIDTSSNRRLSSLVSFPSLTLSYMEGKKPEKTWRSTFNSTMPRPNHRLNCTEQTQLNSYEGCSI